MLRQLMILCLCSIVYPTSYSGAFEFIDKDFPEYGVRMLVPKNWQEKHTIMPMKSCNEKRWTYEHNGSLMIICLRDLPSKQEAESLFNLKINDTKRVESYINDISNTEGITIRDYWLTTVYNKVMLVYTFKYEVEHYGMHLTRYGSALEGLPNTISFSLTFLGRFADTEKQAGLLYEKIGPDLIGKVMLSVVFYPPYAK